MGKKVKRGFEAGDLEDQVGLAQAGFLGKVLRLEHSSVEQLPLLPKLHFRNTLPKREPMILIGPQTKALGHPCNLVGNLNTSHSTSQSVLGI